MASLSEDALRDLVERLQTTLNDPLVEAKKKHEENTKAVEAETQARKQSTEAIRQYAQKTSSYFDVIENSKGNLTALNATVDMTIGRLGKLGAVSSEIIKGVNQRFQKLVASFGTLVQTGIVKSVDDVRAASKATGLQFDDLTTILSKYSKQVAYLGSSTIDGRKRFEEVAAASEEIRTKFERMGVSTADFNEYQLNYMNLLQQTGKLEGKTTADLVGGTRDYIFQLDALAKLTGKSRKELQSDMDARMRDIKFRASIVDMEEGAANRLRSALDLLGAEAPNISAGLKDLVAANGAATTDAAKALVSNFGNAAVEVAAALKAGTMAPEEAFNRLRQGAPDVVEKFKNIAGVASEGTLVLKNFVEAVNLSNRKNIAGMKSDEVSSKAVFEGKNDLNTALADIRQSLYKSGVAIQQMTTGFENAAKVMRDFAKVTEGTIEWLESILTGGLSNVFKIPQKVVSGLKNLGSSTFAGLSGLGSELMGAPGNFLKWIGEKTGMLPPSAAPPPAPGSPESAENLRKVKNYVDFMGGRTGHEGNFNDLQSKIKESFANMAAEWYGQTNERVMFTSGYRDSDTDFVLENEMRAEQGKKALSRDEYDKKRGIKKHPQGLAIDIDRNQARRMAEAGLFQRYGFKWLGDDDPVHIEMRKGGIATGPSSGYPAELHGRELVAPINQNSILEKLARTSADEMSSSSSTNFASDINNAMNKIGDIFGRMQSQQSDMLRELSAIKQGQNTILMRRYA